MPQCLYLMAAMSGAWTVLVDSSAAVTGVLFDD